jgi:hypothetical protein
MKNIKLYLTAIMFIFIACEKEYIPVENAFRDEALFGTWIRLQHLDSNHPTVEVYNEQGYCGRTSSFSNAQSNNQIAFQGIDGIWHVEKANNENIFQYNRIQSQKRFRNGIWEHTEEYYFQNDTLFLRNIRYDDWDTLVKYKYQLIYDGPKYIDLDTIN